MGDTRACDTLALRPRRPGNGLNIGMTSVCGTRQGCGEESAGAAALLALLARGPAHGYELKQDLEQLLGSAYPQPNVGQIYVTLGRLEKTGLIEGEEVEQSSRPTEDLPPHRHRARGAAGLVPGDGGRAPGTDEFFMKLALAHRPASPTRSP